MIVRNAFKTDRFLSAIACTIARDERARIDPADCTRERYDSLGVFYLAGGYWRATAEWDGDRLIGVRLINPDRTPAEVRAVEQGIAVLIGCDWQE